MLLGLSRRSIHLKIPRLINQETINVCFHLISAVFGVCSDGNYSPGRIENLTAGSTNTSIAKPTEGRTLAALFCVAFPSIRANKKHSSILFIEAFSFQILGWFPKENSADFLRTSAVVSW